MDDERAARLLAAADGEHGCSYDHTGGAVLLAAPMASLLIGAFLAHLSSRFCPWLPYTPTLALIGILVAYIALEQGECSHMRGSITSWVDINGHALLFLFLPPLLFADTMHMDWELAKTSLLQCMLLAGPGVLLGSGLHMIYGSYMLPYDWDLLLSLGFGAVQAATDPVAVVSLLSSLGAPVTLTMIISGESLLNDGTAIVVWNVAFYTYLGEGENPLVYAIRLIFGGLGIGIAFWLGTLFWMSRLNRRHGHTDGTIQVALTVFAAYTCFYVAEGVCHVSGVLAVVSMGAGLGATFWPLVCSKETMQGVWHIFEWLLNTFLFQLAGLIIGARLVWPMANPGAALNLGRSGDPHLRSLAEAGALGVTGEDVGLAVGTWVVGCVIRAIVLAVHYPALKRLGYGLTKKDATVCWWGGLHGGVGLALAMSMEGDLRAAGQAQQGMRILLHVSVAAMLTLLVNAPTMAPLLRKFGLTSTSAVKQQKYKDMRGRVNAYAWAEYNKLLQQGKHTPNGERWKAAIPTTIHLMSNEQERRQSLQVQMQAKVQREESKLGGPSGGAEASEMPSQGATDPERLMEARRAFLLLVRNAYTTFVEEGVIPGRSSLSLDLTASLAYANDHIDEPLADWKRLAQLSFKLPAMYRIGTKLKLMKNTPDAYAEHVAFALTAYIGAHQHAQDELKWMFGSKQDTLNAEQKLVRQESDANLYKAKKYLYEMHQTVSGVRAGGAGGADADDVFDYVKSRQIAGVLLTKLAHYIERLHRHGVLEEWMAEKMLHEVEHDEVDLPKHLKKVMAEQNGGGASGSSQELIEALQAQYLRLMAEENIDVRKRTYKEKIAEFRADFKKVKHLPGQKADVEEASTASVQVITDGGGAPPPPPGGAAGGPALPAGWSSMNDEQGRTYYVNSATGAVQWEPPAA